MNTSEITNLDSATRDVDQDRKQVANPALDPRVLQQQNRVYAGTGGISANNRAAGFVPGFLDTRSGVSVPSRFANGLPAPVHVLEGLPEEWIAERNDKGLAVKACQGVIAGFLRLGRFYSRDEAALAMAA